MQGIGTNLRTFVVYVLLKRVLSMNRHQSHAVVVEGTSVEILVPGNITAGPKCSPETTVPNRVPQHKRNFWLPWAQSGLPETKPVAHCCMHKVSDI